MMILLRESEATSPLANPVLPPVAVAHHSSNGDPQVMIMMIMTITITMMSKMMITMSNKMRSTMMILRSLLRMTLMTIP